jgi:hypothetical protein
MFYLSRFEFPHRGGKQTSRVADSRKAGTPINKGRHFVSVVALELKGCNAV